MLSRLNLLLLLYYCVVMNLTGGGTGLSYLAFVVLRRKSLRLRLWFIVLILIILLLGFINSK